MTGIQYRVLLLAALTIVLDGFDIQLLAFAAPAILKEWGLTKADLGPVLSAALIGMAAGALIGGRLGDRLGRKTVLIGSVVVFSLGSLAVAFVDGLGPLGLLRLVTGVGLGAAIPNAAALVAESMPAKTRNLGVTLVIVGVPVGGMVGAALSQWLIPEFGWRLCFMVGGAAPLCLALLMVFAMPESPRWRALEEKAPEQREPGGWRVLFDREHRLSTIGLWLAFFTNMLSAYAFMNWVPTLLAGQGLPMNVAIQGSLYFNLFGVLGSLLGAWLIGVIGSRATLTGLSLLGLFSTLATAAVLLRDVALPVDRVGLIMAGLAVTGGAVVAAQVGLYAVAAAIYRTVVRSTGIGSASFVGRLGGITSALGLGAVLAFPRGEIWFFALLAVVLVLTTAGVLLIQRHIARDSPPIT